MLDEAKLSDFKHWVAQIEIYLDNTRGWHGASWVLCHVCRHQTEVDNSEFGELFHTVSQTADHDHPALSYGDRTFDIKANELYSFVFL